MNETAMVFIQVLILVFRKDPTVRAMNEQGCPQLPVLNSCMISDFSAFPVFPSWLATPRHLDFLVTPAAEN